ncbi:galactose-binding domain-like protein [Gamsiella multidivaricata]|uniref:galactose-binding domain-like protein n=1 Tax=Gamsiella multidivaricata TaxID=101098 RepID=UPI0022211CFC|nr:galactose-binding domain-like protein [Gamsiella multidivaricata]KAG0368800.1 Allantoicase [Gamsiella multidivaricata]KAI7817465.1 galactose-binding domain-like protein [Gamsiella multidivaricata]
MGQVQSREQEESHFKLDSSDEDGLIHKYTELASSAKGGKVLETTDELFGEASQLIKDGPAIEDKERETANGFWKDGWETRRHNKNTHHTAIIQLASAGTIAGFDIDTSFFDGSHPAYASIEACLVVKGVQDTYVWTEILPKIPLGGNSHHYYGIKASDDVYTHIKLNMYPDGGIARLRVYGNVSPIFPDEKTVIDLASLSSGARVIKASDDRYGKPSNLILPTPGVNTRDGWQTRRSRVEGHHDWVEIKLGATGLLETLEVDTTHFRGNNPDFVSLHGCQSEYNDVQYDPEVKWVNLLKKAEVEGDKKNIYSLKSNGEAYSHVRVNIFPDGGISRLRVYGVRVPEPVVPAELEIVEEQLIVAVDDLRVNEPAAKAADALSAVSKATDALLETTTTTTEESTTVIETEEIIREDGNVILTSEVSSVTTLVDEENEPVKKSPAKRGRPKTAGNVALAAAKLTNKKKTKGRSASVLDDEDELSETTASTPPRAKKMRE